MSLLLTFMELDKLYESTMSRQDLIDHIKAAGKNYNFNNKSTEQLFRIWERIQKDTSSSFVNQEYKSSAEHRRCPECGVALTDGGLCPVCDDGEEDYFKAESLCEWVDSHGKRVTCSNTSSVSAPVTQNNISANSSTSNVVTIVYDASKHKLRAQANDGVHGIGNVAFPNNLRTHEGQQYEVETLTWNGKNYRVSGDIKPI